MGEKQRLIASNAMDPPSVGSIAMEKNLKYIASNVAGNTSVSNVRYGLYPKQADSVPRVEYQGGRGNSKRK